MERKCSGCNKLTSNFDIVDGVPRKTCITCTIKRKVKCKKFRETHKEELKVINREYREAGGEEYKEYQKQYHQKYHQKNIKGIYLKRRYSNLF